MTIYNGESMKAMKKILKENFRKGNAIYRNRFYCIGREGGEEREIMRNSKDKIINNEEKDC